MAHKTVITAAEFNALGNELKPHFIPWKDAKTGQDVRPGHFIFDGIPFSDGDVHVTVEDVGGLKRTLAETKTTRDQHATQLNAFKDLNPDEARAAMAKVKTMTEGVAPDKLKEAREQAVIAVKAEHEKELKKATDENGNLTSEVHRLVVESGLQAAFAKAGAPGAAPLLLPALTFPGRATVRAVKTESGRYEPRVFDERGIERVTLQKGSGPMGLDEYIGILKNDSSYAPAFAGSGTSGGGSQSSGNGASGRFSMSDAEARAAGPAVVQQRMAEAAAAKQPFSIT